MRDTTTAARPLLETSLPLTEGFDPEYLEYWGIFPIGVSGGRLRVAVSGSPGREVLEDLETTFGAPVDAVEVDRPALEEAIRRTFDSSQSVDALVRSLTPHASASEADPSADPSDTFDLANQPPVVRYVNLLIKEAHEARATDIHVEATARGPVVRYRIDGVLSAASAPPPALYAAVLSRLKLIADLDIAERQVPQDGRIRLRLEQQDLDIRVSTVPTLFGESVVLRLLEQDHGLTTLESLGMDSALRDRFAQVLKRPHGILLSTGPTGSGKTTTLYAAIQLRDSQREKIITVEDPIEYRLPSVTQVPVNRKAGMTFAAGLRAILRQDPDVVMVGEIRDSETARIAVQAAMTGHLVLSTVHTNDAASAVSRLVDLGIEPYLIAATLQGVLAQRLVRRICRHCGDWSEDSGMLLRIMPAATPAARVPRAVGCAVCRQTGYIGRVGLFELLAASDPLRAQIVRSPDAQSLRGLAVREGFQTLRHDGQRKVVAGLTTVEEVLRAIEA